MKWGRIILVIFGAVIVTALGLDAADTLSGNRGTMLGQLIATDQSAATCPEGMVQMNAPTTFICVDKYEATPDEACAPAIISSTEITKSLLRDPACGAASLEGVKPWIYVSRDDAILACAQAGKRLPSASEWYQFAVGTPDGDSECNIVGGRLGDTGLQTNCLSASGVYDTVGNVWEWVTDDVFDGHYNNRPLPVEGYVHGVDQAGVATLAGESSNSDFGEDYILTEAEGVFGMMRGGFYGSREDAGVFALQAAIPTIFAGAAVGFRCVK